MITVVMKCDACQVSIEVGAGKASELLAFMQTFLPVVRRFAVCDPDQPVKHYCPPCSRQRAEERARGQQPP